MALVSVQALIRYSMLKFYVREETHLRQLYVKWLRLCICEWTGKVFETREEMRLNEKMRLDTGGKILSLSQLSPVHPLHLLRKLISKLL
jgi:hypothetical protein